MNETTASSAAFLDAYAPQQIAVRVRDVGVAKATAPVLTTVALAVLAGAFISLGALFYTVTVSGAGPDAPFGLMRLAGGVAFSLGLILVVVGGAELFTGNNLIAMAWAAGRLRTGDVLRNWAWVYAGNLLGALGTVALVLLAGVHELGDGALGETAIRIARTKAGLDPMQALMRGVLCNVLVCLAIWLCMGARSVTDKILARVSDQRLRGLRLRAFHREHVFSAGRDRAGLLERGADCLDRCDRQPYLCHDRERVGRDRPGGNGLLVYLFTRQ